MGEPPRQAQGGRHAQRRSRPPMPSTRCSTESARFSATTDVYGIANLDQNAATILLRGAVTESLDPASKNLEGPKNNPMMPLAWLREYTAPNGTTKGKAFCTTLGASTDFADEDLRRLVVNASLHLTGQKVPAKADVGYRRSVLSRPSTARSAKRTTTRTSIASPTTTRLARAPPPGFPDRSRMPPPRTAQKKTLIPSATPHSDEPATASVAPSAGGGPAFARRANSSSSATVSRNGTFTTAASKPSSTCGTPTSSSSSATWAAPGDTPGFRPHPARNSQWAFPGAEKFRPEFSRHSGKGFFPTPDQWLTHLKADTIVAFFGYNESFDGPNGVDELRGGARRLRPPHAEQSLQRQRRAAPGAGFPHRLRKPLKNTRPPGRHRRKTPTSSSTPPPWNAWRRSIRSRSSISSRRPGNSSPRPTAPSPPVASFPPRPAIKQLAGLLADGVYGAAAPEFQGRSRPRSTPPSNRKTGSGRTTTTSSTASIPTASATTPSARRTTRTRSRRPAR